MKIRNYEFKARVEGIEQHEEKLLTLHPVYIGHDRQVDTYFNVPQGRLKLREGNIENALICYHRDNTPDSKLSEIMLYKHEPNPGLKQILALQFGVKVVVDKNRKIYFIDNIKFHFDTVMELGSFIEVEAIDSIGYIPIEALKQQCDHYKEFFGLTGSSMMAESYSDMIERILSR